MNARILRFEVRDEILGIVREPTALFFSVLMPVAFFALFAAMFGEQGGFGVESVATYGAFGVLSVVVMNPGIGLADARERGWLRVKRADGTPLGTTLTAKVSASVPYAVITLTGITVVAWFIAGPMDVALVARVAAVLVLGALPFSLFSLAIGAKLSPNATTAVLNAILIPSVIMSGLWFPLDMLPDVMADIAVFLPPYHLAQLALAQVDGGAMWGHVAYLLAATVVAAIAAAMAYRSAKA